MVLADAVEVAEGKLDRDPKARHCGRRPFIATLVFAGLRISEACAAKRRDLALPNGRLIVPDSKTAAGRPRVEILGGLRDELIAYAGADSSVTLNTPLFPNTREAPQRRQR
jgi:integrase